MSASSKPPLLPSLRDMLEEERRALGDHPDVEEWMAFRAGHLPSARAESLRDHLAVCRECADLVLDLAAFTSAAPPEGASPVSDAQIKAALWKVQAELGLEPAAVSSPKRPVWRIAVGLIAASLLAVVGLTTWNQLRPGTPGFQANVPVTDEMKELVPYEASPEPPGTERGGGDRARGGAEPLSATEEHALGLPLPEGTEDFQGYSLEVLAGDGDRVYEKEALELQSGMDQGAREGLTLQVPKGMPAGSYRVQVYGADPGRSRELIATYPFEITP